MFCSALEPCQSEDLKWDIFTESDFVTGTSQENIYKRTGCYNSCSYSQYRTRVTSHTEVNWIAKYNYTEQQLEDDSSFDLILNFFLEPSAIVTEREASLFVKQNYLVNHE